MTYEQQECISHNLESGKSEKGPGEVGFDGGLFSGSQYFLVVCSWGRRGEGTSFTRTLIS